MIRSRSLSKVEARGSLVALSSKPSAHSGPPCSSSVRPEVWLGPAAEATASVQPAHVWRRACGLGRWPESCLGPGPFLALNLGPSLRGCSKIPKAFEHIGSNLSVLEAVWRLQKLFKVSRICCVYKGCCSRFPEWFEVLGEGPRGRVGVRGWRHAVRPAWHWRRSSWQPEPPVFSPKTKPANPLSPLELLLF